MQDGDDKIDAPDRNIAAFAIEEADDLTIHCTPFTQRLPATCSISFGNVQEFKLLLQRKKYLFQGRLYLKPCQVF